MKNESLSGQSRMVDRTESTNNDSIRKKLDGHFAELILSSLIDAFHSTAVLALTPDGTVLFANRIAANGFIGFDSDTVVGQNLIEITPRAWALERIEFMKLAIQRQKPLIIFEIISGTRLCSTINPIQRIVNEQTEWMLLITAEQITPMKLKWLRQTRDPDSLFDAAVIDLGPLSSLTAREIEVLAMMGQGLRQKEIAEALHRSVSTVDRHREKIGEKLGVTDRAELIAMAREAALEVADAKRVNASFGLSRFTVPPKE